MKPGSFLLSCAVCSAVLSNAFAQSGSVIDISADEKVIVVDSLGLSGGTPASKVLVMLPELLARPGIAILENYDVIVDGLAVGFSRDAALSQLTIADIDKITVSQNPIASYQSNSQSGTIVIELKKVAGGFSGNASMDMLLMMGNSTDDNRPVSPFDYLPKLMLDYSGDRISLRGLSITEHYNPGASVTRTSIPYPAETTWESSDERFTSQMNAVWAETPLGRRSQLKMSMAYLWVKDRDDWKQVSSLNPTDKVSSTEKKQRTVVMTADYTGNFKNGACLKMSANADASPGTWASDYSHRQYDVDRKQWALAGKVELKQPFKFDGAGAKGSLSAGVNANLSDSWKLQKEKQEVLFALSSTRTKELETDGRTGYVMPYLTANAGFGSMTLDGILNYKMYRSTVSRTEDREFEMKYRDMTGKFIAAWEFEPGQKLRVMFDKKLQRPSDTQTYPYLVYAPDSRTYVQGNSSLKPVKTNEIGMDYITQSTHASRSVILNMGLSYLKVTDLITQTQGTFQQEQDTYSCTLFENSGANNIARANFMLYLRHNIYSISLAGNMYSNIGDYGNATSDHYAYCDLALNQSLLFNNGWGGTVGLFYNSKVRMNSSTSGDLTYGNLRVSKDFGALSVDAELKGSLSGDVRDCQNKGSYTVDSNYRLVKTSLELTARYRF